MQLLIKLYALGLDSISATLPITIKNKHQFELTLRDLKKEIHKQLHWPVKFKPQYQIINIHKKSAGEFTRIDQMKDLTVLESLGVHNGTIIHLQDSRLQKEKHNVKAADEFAFDNEEEEESQNPDIDLFVKQDFQQNTEA